MACCRTWCGYTVEDCEEAGGKKRVQAFDCARLVTAVVIDVKIGEPLQPLKSKVDEPCEHRPLLPTVQCPAALITELPAFARRGDTQEVFQSPIRHERIAFKVEEDIPGRWGRQPREPLSGFASQDLK